MKAIVYITMFLISGIWLSSCRSVQYVPVETVRTEIEYRDRLQRDSIHVHDSIHIRDKGDTVFVDRWHTVYKDKLLRDTTYIEKTDSIQVPYPVEKEITNWQRFSQRFTVIMLIIIGVSIVLFIRRKFKR